MLARLPIRLPDWLIAQFTRVLVGEIYPEIRAIALRYSLLEKKLLSRCYLDREPTDDDYEVLSVAHTELFAALLYLVDDYDYECIYSNEPLYKLDPLDGLIYARKEMQNSPKRSSLQSTKSPIHMTPQSQMEHYAGDIDQPARLFYYWLRARLTQVLVGKIYPEIRAIAVKYAFQAGELKLFTRCYLDREPTADDCENMSIAHKELAVALGYDPCYGNMSAEHNKAYIVDS